MTRIALAALCVLLAGPAWGQIYGPCNPGMIMCDPPIHWPSGMIPTGGHLVETPQGIAIVPKQANPILDHMPLSTGSDTCVVGDAHCPSSLWGGCPVDNTTSLSGPFAQPTGVTIGGVTLDLDKGTVDLHGAKIEDAAKAFWSAVQDVMSRCTVTPRAYTLDDIDRMRAIVRTMMTIHYPPCHETKSVMCFEGANNVSTPSDIEVEVRLHTYMAAGVSPEELERKAAK